MFELTDNACKELDAFFDGKEKSPIRVYLAPGGCSGPRLALALDAPTDTDTVFEDKGYAFCMNNELYGLVKGVKIDFTYMGFFVQSEEPLNMGGGCAGCSGAADGACGTA